MYFHQKNLISNDFHQIQFLNLGGQSGPVESKSRWPGGQIRWPRANGPVLTTSLLNVPHFVLLPPHDAIKGLLYVQRHVPVKTYLHTFILERYETVTEETNNVFTRPQSFLCMTQLCSSICSFILRGYTTHMQALRGLHAIGTYFQLYKLRMKCKSIQLPKCTCINPLN